MQEYPTEKNGEENDERPKPQETIFADETAGLGGYDKNLRNARVWLYLVAALQIGVGVFQYVQYDMYDDDARLMLLGISGGVGLVFLGLAIWSIKKPVPAFLTALIAYPLINIIFIIMNPANLGLGIVIKVIIVVMLYRAYKDAKDNEDLRTTFGNNG